MLIQDIIFFSYIDNISSILIFRFWCLKRIFIGSCNYFNAIFKKNYQLNESGDPLFFHTIQCVFVLKQNKKNSSWINGLRKYPLLFKIGWSTSLSKVL